MLKKSRTLALTYKLLPIKGVRVLENSSFERSKLLMAIAFSILVAFGKTNKTW